MFKTKSSRVEVIDVPAPVNPHADLEAKANGASSIAGYALNSFEATASDLEIAARDQELVAQIASARIEDLKAIVAFNLAEAQNNRTAAQKIRDLIGSQSTTDVVSV